MAKPILIAGPTASGKSALAMELARAHNAAIINADSQQVFRDWRVLTARPSVEDEATAPHHLFGHLPLAAEYSVGHWLRDVEPIVKSYLVAGRTVIIVGGTGLYFKALTEGIAPIPPTPPEIRARGEAELSTAGLPAFLEAFAARDPKTADRIDTANPMRVLRAWEVLETTGIGLAAWQEKTDPPLLPLSDADARLVVPDRETLYARCDARFDRMLQEGALEEAKAVADQNPPASAPGLKALGAQELLAHVRGEITLDEAAERTKLATRRYAKRQLTWGRNQMAGWRAVPR